MNQITENLSTRHKKNKFSCGKEMLDNYLHKQANQDIKRKLSACFVINDKESKLIKGYYTLARNSIPLNVIPTPFQKNYQNHILLYRLPYSAALQLTVAFKEKELENYY